MSLPSVKAAWTRKKESLKRYQDFFDAHLDSATATLARLEDAHSDLKKLWSDFESSHKELKKLTNSAHNRGQDLTEIAAEHSDLQDRKRATGNKLLDKIQARLRAAEEFTMNAAEPATRTVAKVTAKDAVETAMKTIAKPVTKVVTQDTNNQRAPLTELRQAAEAKLKTDINQMIKSAFNPADETKSRWHAINTGYRATVNAHIALERHGPRDTDSPRPNTYIIKLRDAIKEAEQDAVVIKDLINKIAANRPRTEKIMYEIDLNKLATKYGIPVLESVTASKEQESSQKLGVEATKTVADSRVIDHNKGAAQKLNPTQRKVPIRESDSKPATSAIIKHEKLKSNLFATISLHPEGLAASRLCREYKKQHGVELDVRYWGCYSVAEFCAMLPQVFTLARGDTVGSSEDRMLYSSCRSDCELNKKHACTLGPEEKIPRQELPDNVRVGEYLEVVVAEVVSPEEFWIQLKGKDMNRALVWLMEEIKHFYGESFQGYKVSDEDFLSAGMVCANLHSDGYWYRAVVTSFRDLTTVEVFFIDYGNVFQVKKSSLAYLHRRFGKLPGQAFKARLDGIKPAGERRDYTKKATQRFLELTDVFAENTEYLGLLAMVRGLGERLSLSLVDTCTNDLPQGVVINQELVNEGFAVPDACTTNQVNNTQECTSST